MRVVQRRPHAVSRFAHLGIGQADDMEGRQSGPQMHLDGDLGRVDAGKRAARHGGDGHGS